MKPKYEYGTCVNYLENDGEIITGWVEDVFADLDPDNNDEIVGYTYVFKRVLDSQMKMVNERRIWDNKKIIKSIRQMCDL